MAILVGVVAPLVAGFAHDQCAAQTRLCLPTTDTTVWAYIYPIMCIPFYAATALAFHWAGRSGNGT